MKHVLVTGSSGVLGTALLRKLLRESHVVLHLVLRAASDDQLRKRFRQLRASWGIPENATESQTIIRAYRGDVSREQMGLAGDCYRTLTETVTHLIHCAGNVKLNQPREAARRDAVVLAKVVTQFARDASARGQLQKVDVTSTVGVAGCMSGLVHERRYHEPRRFRNTYEHAKAEAEYVYWSEIGNGLPLTIHRPSMLVGDSQTGEISHFQVFYYLAEFLTGKHTLGVLPQLRNVTLDIIPVDVAAQAMAISSRQPSSAGRVFHECSGPHLAIPLQELADAYADFCRRHGEMLPTHRSVPVWLLRRFVQIATIFTRGRVKRSLQTLPFFLAYLNDPQTFDNSETLAFLRPFGWTLPAPDEYLQRVFNFYWRQRIDLRRQDDLAAGDVVSIVPTGPSDDGDNIDEHRAVAETSDFRHS